MEYQIYNNTDMLLNDSSKTSWSMESNGDFFIWNNLKIDQDDVKIAVKKRKLIQDDDDDGDDEINEKKAEKKINVNDAGDDDKKDGKKGNNFQKVGTTTTTTKMPHWQVEDYEEINTDIENSLTLAGDLVNHNYNVSENILSMNGITMFKQEAPSPTSNNNENSNKQHRQSPISSSTQNCGYTNSNNGNGMSAQSTTTDNGGANAVAGGDNGQGMLNSSITQLLSPTALANLHNVIDYNNLSPTVPQDNYVVSSSNYSLMEDCRFQYVLAAATSIATKQNEDTLTYLNQGQSYEIKLKKLGDLSHYKGKMLKSVIRICFHERRLQYMEKEQMLSWQKARPGDRILEVDVPLSYGAYDITQPGSALNLVHFNWDPTKEVGIYIKVNCISTEFTPKKHGGEKGVPFRIQVETYQSNQCSLNDEFKYNKRLHAAACQIKVFKLKGADRKHKQDREKIMKRPLSEQEKYQPSYECTVLNDLSNDAVLVASPSSPIADNSSMESNPQIQYPNIARSESNYVPPQNIPDVKNHPQENYADKKLVTSTNDANLTQHSTPEETAQWLTRHRFNKHLNTFDKFSGDDLLRMTREDLVQICGSADGIRLHNSIHSKTISPKLRLYVRQDGSAVYNAVFLSSFSAAEFLQKLCILSNVVQHQVRDVYIEGPHSIHVQVNDDLLRHVKDETMFCLEIVQQSNDGFVFLLKSVVK